LIPIVRNILESAVFFGIIFKSTALIADGMNSLTDLITDFVSLFGEKLAKSKNGRKKTIFEDKTSIVVGAIITILSIIMIVQAFNTEQEIPNKLVIYVSLFVIAVKILITKYLSKTGKKLNNSIIISRAKESGGDVITSLIALFGILLSQFSQYISVLKYSDIAGGLIIGIITFCVGLNIVITNEKDINSYNTVYNRDKFDGSAYTTIKFNYPNKTS